MSVKASVSKFKHKSPGAVGREGHSRRDVRTLCFVVVVQNACH